jgi:selenocysteine lyase/cysteine desulfurase
VPVLVKDLGVDFGTVVGHKFGAPKGCAALYVRAGIFASSHGPESEASTLLPRFPPLIFGGGQVRD